MGSLPYISANAGMCLTGTPETTNGTDAISTLLTLDSLAVGKKDVTDYLLTVTFSWYLPQLV